MAIDEQGRSRENDIPNFYIYEHNGKWMRTSEATTREINDWQFRRKGTFDTAGHSFYPQWTEPDFKTEQKIAWRITKDGDRVARWSWVVHSHDKSHRFCKPLKDGNCAHKVLRKLSWDPKVRLWTLDKLDGQPSPDEVRNIKD